MSQTIVSTRSIDRVISAFDDVDVHVVEKQRYPGAELRDIVGDAAGLFVHSENEFDAELLRAAPGLRAIAKPGSGIDNIDVEEATAQDVVVIHTPGMNAVAVAEFTVGAILSQLRSIPDAQAHLQSGGWRSEDWWGTELRGKTVGLVGLGATGIETARRLRPFCEELVVYDPYVSDQRVDDVGGQRRSFEELFATSDVVSVHVRLTPDTRELVDASAFELLDDDALFVNTSRGAVVNRDALVDAIRADEIGGAVLDVFHEEPPGNDHPLYDREDVLTTPHLAGATEETRTEMLNTAANSLRALLDGEPVDEAYVANPDAL